MRGKSGGIFVKRELIRQQQIEGRKDVPQTYHPRGNVTSLNVVEHFDDQVTV